MIYRPPEAAAPTRDGRASREIVAGLLGMAFLLATLIWYTADLWCGAVPWLCLDGLVGGVAQSDATPTALPTRAPLAPSTAAAPLPGSGALSEPGFGAAPFAPPVDTPSFVSPPFGVPTADLAPTSVFDVMATPEPIVFATPPPAAAVSSRRAAMTATAEAARATAGGFEPGPRGATPSAGAGSGTPTATAPGGGLELGTGTVTTTAAAAATATDAAYP